MSTFYSIQMFKMRRHLIALLLWCAMWPAALHAATIESTATGGSWTSTSTWVGGVVPGSTDDVVIATTPGNSVTLPGAVTCNELTINQDATLAANNHLVTVRGNFIIIGTFTSTTGGLTLSGTADQQISGFTTTGTITMAKTGGTATFVGNINAAALTINGAGGTLNLGTRNHTFTGAVTLTNGSLLGNTSTVNLSLGGAVWTGTGSLFTANSSTVVLTGAAQTISTTTTFNNLTYSGSAGKTIAASVTVTVNGLFTIANGTNSNTYTGTLAYGPNAGLVYSVGTSNRTTTNVEWPSPFLGTAGVTINGTAPGIITMNAAKQMGNNTNVPLRLNPGATLSTGNLALTLHGDFINSATLTAGSSAINIGGTVATQNIGGFVTTGAINMTKTAGTATATAAFSAGSLSINGPGGTLNLSNFTHTISGTILLNIGTLDASSATLSTSGSITIGSATFLTTNMNLTLTGTGVVTIPGFTSTGTITNNRGNTGNSVTVQGNLNIGNIVIAGSSSSAGPLNLGTNLTHTITGSITQTLGTINLGTNTTINLTGTGTVISGTITAGTSTVVLAGAAQTIAANTFNNLTYAGTGAKTAGALTINGLFTIANGSNTNTFTSTVAYGSTGGLRYDAGSSNRIVGAEWPASFASTGATVGVNVAGTGTITLNEAKTLGIATGTAGANVPLTIEAGATLNTAGFAMTFQANFTNNGTFNAGSSAITFTRNLTQTITGPISTTGLFTVSKTAGTDVLNINGAVSAAGFTQTGGTINMGNGLTHTFSGTWSRVGGILNLNNSTLVFTATGTMFSGSGSILNAGTGTVVFSGNGNTTCPILTYNNLTLSNSGTKTFATTPTVNGILSLEGTATVVVTTGVVTYGGDATLRYNKPSPYTTTGEEFPNTFLPLGGVIIAGTGTITLDAAKNIAYKLTINTGASVNLGTGLTHTSRGLVLGGAAPQTGNFGGTGSGATTIDPVFFAAATGQLNSVPFAATWTGAVDTDWENNGNWAEGSKPNSFTDAIIPVTVNQPVLTAAAVSKNLEIAAGATVNTAGFQYTLNGHLFNSGTLTLSNSNIVFDGILNQLINGFTTTGNLTSTKTGGIARFTSAVSAASLTVNGAAGTVNLGNGLHTISGNVTVTAGTLRGGSASLEVSGNISGAGTFTGDTLNITYAGTAAQTSIGYTTLGSVTMTKTAETVTLTGPVNAISLTINGTGGTLNLGTSLTHTISGNVTLNNGTLNGGTATTLNLTGNWTGTGSNFTAGTSVVALTGVTQSVLTSTTFNSLTFGGTGAKTIAASVTVTINGTLTITNGGTANIFTGTITYGPSAGITYNSGNRTVGGEWPVTFNGTGGITILQNVVTLNESKILGPGVNLTVNVGVLGVGTLNLTMQGDILGASNISSTTGIITFTGSANQSVRGFSQTSSGVPTSGSVVVNKTGGTLTFTSDLVVGTGGFSATLSGGASIVFNPTVAISFGGNYTVSGGTVNFNNCNVTLFGTFATQNLDGFATTGNLIITKASGTATLGALGSQAFSAASLTVNGAAGILVVNTAATLALTGTTTLTAGTLRILGTLNTSASTPFSGTGATLVAGSASTFNYSGSAQTVRNLTYFNLILSGSGVKTTTSSVNVNGRLTLEGTASLSAAITYGGEASLRYNRTTSVTTSDFEFPSLFQFSGGVIIGGTATVTLNSDKTITAPLIIETGAQLNLSTFTGSSSKGLTLGVATQAVGTYGGNTSAAGTINATFFADATGILTVTAPDATWLGLTSDWSAPTNWSIGVVPDVSTSAIINSGTPFQPVLTAASNCAALTVGAGASLTTNGFQMGIYGSFTNAGTVTWGSSNIIIGGGLTQSIAAITTTGNITVVKNSNTATLAGAMSANSLTMNGSGGTLNLGAALTHTFTGNITITAGTLAGGSSNLTFTGSSDVSIGAFTTTGNFTFTKASGTATFTGNISVNTITLNGAAFTLNLGTGITHTMTGNMTITAGTLQGGSSNLVIAGTNTQTIAGFSTTGNITMTKASGTATISGNMSFNTLTLNGTSGILALGSGTHTLTGDIIITAGTLSATGSLIFQGSANQTFPGFTTNQTTGNITSLKTGGTLSLTGNLTIASLILNGPGSTIDLGSSARTHTIAGNITVTAGTLNANAASFNINGTFNQNIAGFTTTGSITMTKTAGTATFTGNVTAANLVLSGAGGALNLGNGLTHTFTGTWTRTNGNLEGGSSILTFTASGNFITGVTGSFLPGTGTVVYGANAAQTIGPFTYNNLVISGSGIKTVTTATVNGVFVMDGTATLSAPITYGSSATLQYTRSTAFTTTANEFPNTFTPSGGVVISGTGTITLDAAKAISGTLTINTGSTMDLNGFTTHSCFGLTLGGTMQTVLGTYGRTGSGAANINDVFFAGSSGRITLNSITTTWLGLSFDWSDPTNWNNGVPTSISDAIVSTGVPQQPLITSAAETRNLTINAGATVISAGMQLSIFGNLVVSGTLTLGVSPVVISGTATQTIDGFSTTGNLLVTKLGGVATVNGDITVHDITVNGAGGTINLGTGLNHTVSGNLTLTAGTIVGGSSNVTFTGASAQNASGFSTTGNITSTKTGGSLSFTSGFSCTDFTMSGAGSTVILGTAFSHTINGNLTINSGTLDAGSVSLSLGGNLTGAGTFDGDACDLILINTANQSIPGFTTTGNLIMQKTGGTATLGGAVTAASLTLNGAGGTLNMGTSHTHTFSGDVTLTQGTLQASNTTIRVSSNTATAWTGDGSLFESGTGTVVFNGNNQTINTSTTFNNITLSGAGSKTFTSGTTTTVNGLMTISNGSSVNTFTGATISYGGTAGLRYNAGASSRTVSAEWPASFSSTGGITIDGAEGGVITLNESKVIGNNNNTHLTINSGATLATNNFAVTLHGNLVQSGTLTAGSSNFTLAGTNATQSIDGFTTTGTVALTKTAGTATLNGNVNAGALTINGTGGTLNLGTGRTHTISGNVTLTDGTLLGGNNTLNVNGSGASAWSGNVSVFSRGTSSVVFGGNAVTLSASSEFHSLSFNGTGTAVVPATLSISGNLVTNQAVNFTSAGNTLTFDGTSLQTVSGTSNPAFVNVTVNSSGNVQLSTNATVSGNVVLQSGDLLLSTQQLTVTGSITRTTGKLGAGSGTLLLNGSSSQSLPASIFVGDSVRNLTMNNSAGVVLNSATRLTGNFTPTAGVLTTNNHLTLGSNNTGTARVLAGSASGGYITGTVVVERYVPSSRRNWRFLSSQITSATLLDWQNETHITGPGGAANGFDATTLNKGSVFTYNETDLATSNSGDKNIGWESATNISNSIVVGKGYRVFVRGDRNPGRLTGAVQDQGEVTLNLNGTLNQGSISLPVTCTFSGPGSTFSAANDGWNLVGNPYACDYDWDHFWTNNNSNPTFFQNLESDVWVFDPVANNYVTYNAVSNTGTGQLVSGIIPSGSSFWVKANNASPVLQLVEASKTASNPGSLFKNDRPDKAFRIVLNDMNSMDADEAAILYHEKALRASDKMDVTKMSGSANIAALTDDGKLTTINSRPAIVHGDTIPLAIRTEKGRYSISFRNVENLHTTLDAVLIDNTTGSVIDVRSTPAYEFDVVETSTDIYDRNRFKILIGAKGQLPLPGNNGITLENAISIFPNPAHDDVFIRQLGGLEIQSALVFDINGKTQLTIPYINSTKFQIDVREWKPGVYFVETTDVKGNVLKQKLIKQ